jgi:hypothetical protein
MAFTALEHHVAEFSSNVELLSQQTSSKLEPVVDVRGFYGEKAEAIKQYGETEFADLTDPTGDTVFDTIDKDSRWVFPADKKNALPTTREDWLRMISDPMSPLVTAQAAALGRLKDAYVLGALGGTAQTGKYDALAGTVLPAGQKLTQVGFTLGLIKDAIQLLEDNDTDDGSGIVVVIPAKYARVLQDDPEFTSSDYNTSQVFVGGNMYTEKMQGFLGATWVTLSNKFLSSTMVQTIAGAGIEDKVYVYRRSGMCLGMWNKDGKMVDSKVDERADKNYLVQVYSKLTLGATRKEEAKVVEITVTVV